VEWEVRREKERGSKCERERVMWLQGEAGVVETRTAEEQCIA
jgi:hypothetical protein